MVGKRCPECGQIGYIKKTSESGPLKTVYRCDYVSPYGQNCSYTLREDTGLATAGKIAGTGLGILASIIAVSEWLDQD